MNRWNNKGQNGKGSEPRNVGKKFKANYGDINWGDSKTKEDEPEKIKRIYCLKCNTTIKSKHTHDMVWCKCGSIAVDGGNDYLRCVGEPSLFGYEYESV